MSMKTDTVREPIATWHRISRYEPRITPVKVVAFTGSFVTYLETTSWWGEKSRIRERREKRDDIFPTFAEAKAEIIRQVKEVIESLENDLQRRRIFLGQAESLEEPRNEN